MSLLLFASTIAAEPHRTDSPATQTGNITGRVQNLVLGNYLNNARISVQRTNVVAFTDQFGFFRINDLPPGPTVLEVFYTGLDVRQVLVTIQAGRTTEQEIELTNAKLFGHPDAAVTLSPFLVAATRETNVETIAVNEQRFASNIKNVVATDAFGDVVDGSMGEFLKFLPGVTADYSDVEIIGVAVRGLASNLTNVSTDGAQTASANFNGANRTFQFLQFPVNNISRIELTKVPTPENPADSMGGSINMITKSAFERRGSELRYRVHMSANSENLTLQKTPYPFEKTTYKTFPGFDFDYTLPLSKDFGLVLVGMSSNQFNEQHAVTTIWENAGTGTGASLANPFFRQFTLRDGGKNSHRNSLSIKADWRVTPASVLSINLILTHLAVDFANLGWALNAGAIGTPTVAGGVPLTFDEHFTNGSTGRATLSLTETLTDYFGVTAASNVRYRLDNGSWKVDAGLSPSSSRISFRDTSAGHFSGLGVVNRVPIRLDFREIGPDFPRYIRAYDNTNQAVDIYDINSYRLTNATAAQRDIKDELLVGDVNVTRRIGRYRLPLTVQSGARYRSQMRDVHFANQAWDYAGPAGNIAAVQSPAPYQSRVYVNVDNGYGFRNVPWPSPHLAWADYQKNPGLFTRSAARIVASESFWRQRSEYIREDVSAFYVQGKTQLLKNRLEVVAGVRSEETRAKGLGWRSDPGAAFQRNVDGSFVLDKAGARIRRPEAGAVGSIEELNLISEERGLRVVKSYGGLYPSLHLNYSATENVLLRLAYARTYGRPDFSEIIPNATFSQNVLTEQQYDDPNEVRGTIVARNANLKPWAADNYDLSLELYTPNGGLFSAGLFLKEIQDFFATRVILATADDLKNVGLDPIYAGWNLSTKFNSGNAQVSGAEFNAKHSLAPLGAWGRHLTVFANGTQLHLKGNRLADFSGFISRSANWGFIFSRQPLIVMAKWNLRGRQKLSQQPAFGTDAFLYYKPRIYLDMNADWQFTKRVSLFANARNVLNEPQTQQVYGQQTPHYARQLIATEYGVQFSIGVKGTY